MKYETKFEALLYDHFRRGSVHEVVVSWNSRLFQAEHLQVRVLSRRHDDRQLSLFDGRSALFSGSSHYSSRQVVAHTRELRLQSTSFLL